MEKKYTNEIVKKYNFSDVGILPNSSIISGSKINIIRNFKWKWSHRKWTGIPLVSSDNIHITNKQTHKVLKNSNWLTIYPTYYTDYYLKNELDDILQNTSSYGLSCGITKNTIVKTSLLIDKMKDRGIFVEWLYIEDGVFGTIEFFRKLYPDIIIIAGNSLTKEKCKDIISSGADIIKIGNDDYKKSSGVEYPQLSAILDNHEIIKEMGAHIMSDGIHSICDCGKALAAGADMLMLNNILGGHKESPGETIWESLKEYKISGEGQEFKIEYRGKLKDTLLRIEESIKILSEYLDVDDIADIPNKSTFYIYSR